MVYTIFMNQRLWLAGVGFGLSIVVLGFSLATGKRISKVIDDPRETILKGQIVFRQDNSIKTFDLVTKKATTLIDNLSQSNTTVGCKIVNNFVFAVTGENTISRKDLITGEVVNKKIDVYDCFPRSKDMAYCEVTLISPSPHADKLVFSLRGGSGEKWGMVEPTDAVKITKLYDWKTGKTAEIDVSDVGEVRWFGDNRFVYLGNKVALDTSTTKKKTIDFLTTETIYPSFSGHRFLWFDEAVRAKERGGGIFDVSRPNMVNSNLGKVFEIENDKDSMAEGGIPFIRFPVVARDFKGITKVIGIKNAADFLVEIDSGGKRDIFWTDSGGTFKKLNPNNQDSYRLVAYLPKINQVLAIRSKEDRSYGVKVLKSELVMLDEGNYAEFVANIDNGPAIYKEKKVWEFEDGSMRDIVANRMAISPDNQSIALATNRKGEKYSYSIVSLNSGETRKLDVDLGTNFEWVDW